MSGIVNGLLFHTIKLICIPDLFMSTLKRGPVNVAFLIPHLWKMQGVPNASSRAAPLFLI
jgi:hypothetical protein